MTLEKATLTTSCGGDAPLRALHWSSGTMAPTLAALLGFGLCLCWETWAQQGALPRPSLRAEPGSVVPQGQPVNLWCKGPPGAGVHRLWKKEIYSIVEHFPIGREALFIIPNMAASTAGSYQCLYRSQSGWSEPSEPLELTVTGLFPPPSLSAWPSSTVAPGQAVTLQCRSQLSHDQSVLYKDGAQVTQARAQLLAQGSQADFSIPAVTSAHGGMYRCYSFQSRSPREWSSPSDPLELRITGTSKDPPLPHSPGGTQALTPSPPSEGPGPAAQDYTVGNVIRLSLAGLVLVLLGVLLAEAWNSSRGRPGGAPASSDRREGGAGGP